jgi:hypothetical protein
MNKHTYDLYPLSWWENPWYIALICMIGTIVLVVAICIYLHKKRTKPLSLIQIRAALNKLAREALVTRAEQQDAYGRAIQLFKQAISLRAPGVGNGDVIDNITDHEYMEICVEKKYILPQDADQMRQLVDYSYMSKFADCTIDPEMVKGHLHALDDILRVYSEKK